MLGLGLGLNRANTINKPLLNQIPNAVGAWGLNRLNSGITYPIRVYRDSDMAETDIGLIGNTLDTASLLSFAGAGSAYVTKIYDQTNNGNNAIQSVAANCPRIVNAGVLEVDSNGDVSVYYDGVDDFLQCDNQVIISGATSLTMFGKFSIERVAKQTIFGTELVCKIQTSINNSLILLSSSSGDSWQITSSFSTYLLNTIYYFTGILNVSDGTNKAYINNQVFDGTGTFIGIGSNLNKFTIGTHGTQEYLKGHISSIIVFNKAITQAEVTKLNRL